MAKPIQGTIAQYGIEDKPGQPGHTIYVVVLMHLPTGNVLDTRLLDGHGAQLTEATAKDRAAGLNGELVDLGEMDAYTVPAATDELKYKVFRLIEVR